jgi:hypothetical protein
MNRAGAPPLAQRQAFSTCGTMKGEHPMSGLQVGVAQRDITPPEEWIAAGRIWLWGYGMRTEPCSGILDRLSVRALVIQDEAANRFVLASVDIGAIEPAMTDAIRSRVSQSQSIPAANICINLTHTHGAPVPVTILTWQPGFQVPDPGYLQLLEDQITGAIDDACRAIRPATIALGRGTTEIAFDRHFGEPGFHDPSLDVMRVTDNDGAVTVIGFFTACHTVCRSAYNEVYADFAGITRGQLEQRYGGMAMFFQGFTGISNPRKRDAEHTGSQLTEDVAAVLEGPMPTLAGPIQTGLMSVDLPFQPMPGDEIRERARGAGGIHERWERRMASLNGREPGALTTPLQLARIGEGESAWYLSASGHEVTADLGPAVRALRPDHRVTLLGFSNSQLSYLPSRRVLTLPAACDEFPFCDNYEGGISFAWYGHRAPLTHDVDDRFMAAQADLFERVGY